MEIEGIKVMVGIDHTRWKVFGGETGLGRARGRDLLKGNWGGGGGGGSFGGGLESVDRKDNWEKEGGADAEGNSKNPPTPPTTQRTGRKKLI